MVRSIGAQIGLLAFMVAVFAGIEAGNAPSVILIRALVALVLGATVGQAAGWAAKLVLRDHLQTRKLEIDRRHFDAVRTMNAADSGSPASEPEPPAAEAG
jgi:hypothetical protein